MAGAPHSLVSSINFLIIIEIAFDTLQNENIHE